MKLSKFITKFIFITAFSSIIAAFLISIFFQYQNFKNEFNHYKKEFTEQKKKEVKTMMSLYDFGVLWAHKPIHKANRQDFIDEYYELLGRTDKKQSCSAILNELSRFFIIKRTRAKAADNPVQTGENYFIIEGAKINEE